MVLGFMVFGASFCRKRARDTMDEVDIPRRAKPYWVPGRPWRFSLPRRAAPRCTRYPGTPYRESVVLHLQHLLFQRHAGHQIRRVLFRR
jgi:hypothetical protein